MAVDVWNEAQWNQFYRVRKKHGGAVNEPDGGWVFGYGKNYLTAGDPTRDHLTRFRQRWSALVSAFGIQPTDRVLVVGCAFGYLMDAANDAGHSLIWGIDNSPYVASAKGVESSGNQVIVEADIRGLGLRNTFRQLTGDDEFHWVVTEDVIACYPTDDSEGANQNVLNLAPLLETLLYNGLPTTRVIHITSVAMEPGVGGDSAFTWLTLAEWKALIPTHSFMSTGLEV